jgi:hypothetical protein
MIIKTAELVNLLDGEYQATWTQNEMAIHTLDGDVIATTINAIIRGTFELDINIEDGLIITD